MISDSELQQIMPHLSAAKRRLYTPHLNAALDEFGISVNEKREAAFLAQIAHESMELKHWAELWGPTPAQRRYEGRADLGNNRPGDGYRYRGRGPIQITGRGNYARYGQRLGVDLVSNPALASSPSVGFRIAGRYWADHNLNALADRGEFRAITKAINGGYNGYEDRFRYWERAKLVLGRDEPVDRPIKVEVNGTLVAARAFIRDGASIGELRPVAKALAWPILEAKNGRALLRVNGENVRVPLLLREGTGYVALRDLPARVSWDAAARTVRVVTE